jgi:hypothetical protein
MQKGAFLGRTLQREYSKESVIKFKANRRTASSGMLRRVALVRTDVSEELSASIITLTTIGELGTTLAVISDLVFFSQRASIASYG